LMFDLAFRPCLIDREHTNDDTIGKHTLPEGLELGEMISNGNVINFGWRTEDWNATVCVVEVSQVENTGESATMSYDWGSDASHSTNPIINSNYRGTIPLIIGLRSGSSNTPDSLIRLYDIAGLGGSIVNVYTLPKALVGSTYYNISISVTVGSETRINNDCVVPADSTGVFSLSSRTFTRPGQINGYTPKNNKLFTYPYCYFNISNNAGTSIPYHYEDFNGDITFETEGTFGASGQTKAIPQNYKSVLNSQNRLDYSINGAKFPICSWKSDSYTNWLTQNAVNLETQWKTTLISGGTAIAQNTLSGASTLGLAGAGIGALGGGLQAGAGLIALAREQHVAKTQANMVPDQVHGNLGAGDFVWAKYTSPFTYQPMSIKIEYARCIDEFFSQFGYKCNRVKIPNITGRRNWNYVKTVGCYITGSGNDVPQEDMLEIRRMFDNGITFWHNPLYFGNYGVNNDII